MLHPTLPLRLNSFELAVRDPDHCIPGDIVRTTKTNRARDSGWKKGKASGRASAFSDDTYASD